MENLKQILEDIRHNQIYASDRMRWPLVSAVSHWATTGQWDAPAVPDYSAGPAASEIGYGAVSDLAEAIGRATELPANGTQRQATATAICRLLCRHDPWMDAWTYSPA